MKPPRIPIGRAMIWIAVVGLNVGLFRAAWRINPDVSVLLVLIALALRLGRGEPSWGLREVDPSGSDS